jgi:hypothetical protein
MRQALPAGSALTDEAVDRLRHALSMMRSRVLKKVGC